MLLNLEYFRVFIIHNLMIRMNLQEHVYQLQEEMLERSSQTDIILKITAIS